MGFPINETTSLILQNSLKKTSKQIESISTKISYGKQTKAVENAANLILSESMEAQKRGSMQAVENSLTGMNMLATAESGLSSVNENLQKIRELTIQRENGTNGDSERSAIDSEIKARMEEIDRTAKTTAFNDVKLLDGSAKDIKLQTGSDGNAGENSSDISSVLSSVKSFDLGLDPSSPDFLKQIDNAISSVTSQRADTGAMQNGLESNVNSLLVKNENITSSQSQLIDTDMAKASSSLIQQQILQNAAISLMAQANQTPQTAMSLL